MMPKCRLEAQEWFACVPSIMQLSAVLLFWQAMGTCRAESSPVAVGVRAGSLLHPRSRHENITSVLGVRRLNQSWNWTRPQ
jgi:hypothetical protein